MYRNRNSIKAQTMTKEKIKTDITNLLKKHSTITIAFMSRPLNLLELAYLQGILEEAKLTHKCMLVLGCITSLYEPNEYKAVIDGLNVDSPIFNCLDRSDNYSSFDRDTRVFLKDIDAVERYANIPPIQI